MRQTSIENTHTHTQVAQAVFVDGNSPSSPTGENRSTSGNASEPTMVSATVLDIRAPAFDGCEKVKISVFAQRNSLRIVLLHTHLNAF